MCIYYSSGPTTWQDENAVIDWVMYRTWKYVLAIKIVRKLLPFYFSKHVDVTPYFNQVGIIAITLTVNDRYPIFPKE